MQKRLLSCLSILCWEKKKLFHPLFLSFGSSSHRKQKASMLTGSEEAGRRCIILPLPVISRFLTIQVVLSTRTGKSGCCTVPTVLSHAPYCRSVRFAVCFKAAKLKTRSRFQIKAAVNHYSYKLKILRGFFHKKRGLSS